MADFIPVYKDESCSEFWFNFPVGDYKEIFGSVPTIQTMARDLTVDGKTYHCHHLTKYNNSQVFDIGNYEWILPPNLEQDDNTNQYFYFNSALRFQFRYLTNRRVSNMCFQVKVSGTWQGFGNTADSSDAVVRFDGFGFFVGEDNIAQYNSYGSIITIADDGVPTKKWIGIGTRTLYINDAYPTNELGMSVFAPNSLLYDYEEPSYKPSKKQKVRGGNGTGGFTGSGLSPMGTAQMNSILNSFLSADGDGLTYYVLNGVAYHDLMSWLYCEGLLKDRAVYRDAFVSAVYVPFKPTMTSTQKLYLANRTYTVDGGGLAWIVSNPIQEAMGGQSTTSVYWFLGQGYNTYADVTELEIVVYLPFFGRVNIDPAAVFQGKLYVRYNCDCRNGNIVYNIITMSKDDKYERVYGSYSANCGVQIPVCGSGQSGTILGKVSNVASAVNKAGIEGYKVGGEYGLAAAAIKAGVLSTIEQNTPIVNKSGIVDPNSAGMDVLDIRIDIAKRVVITPDYYNAVAAFPSSAGVKLSELTGTGWCVFANIHADDIAGATEEEKYEIEQLLKEGVFL